MTALEVETNVQLNHGPEPTCQVPSVSASQCLSEKISVSYVHSVLGKHKLAISEDVKTSVDSNGRQEHMRQTKAKALGVSSLRER